MPVFIPGTDTPALRGTLAQPEALLVVCFCAAWCDTCNAYRPKFEELADAQPGHAYLWIDIEDHAEALGNEDVDNFPTLLIQAGDRTLFYGPMLPHIGHLERLLASLAETRATARGIQTGLPDLRELYLRATA